VNVFAQSLPKDRLNLDFAGLSLSQKHFVHITPAPVLSRLERLHDGMFGLMEVFGGVLILGRVAAADMTADETFPEVDPGIAHLQALLAAFATGLDLANFFYVGTSCLCVWHVLPPKFFLMFMLKVDDR
jgi:hypothetical protein